MSSASSTRRQTLHRASELLALAAPVLELDLIGLCAAASSAVLVGVRLLWDTLAAILGAVSAFFLASLSSGYRT